MATFTSPAAFALLLTTLLSPGVFAQLVEDYKPPATSCCLASAAQALSDQLLDWNQLGRYHADNEALKKQLVDPKRVVFLGDSITDGWKLDEFFPGKPYINRGISGQTTPQMLVRTFPDVIDLKPAAVILLAGTNDIARNTGPETAAMMQGNIQAITELAQAHGIKVVLCSIMPVSDYTNRKQTLQHPPADILRMNAWLREYAGRVKAIYVDYFAVLADEKGMLKNGYSLDGLHPNHRGYELMAPLAEVAIQQALP